MNGHVLQAKRNDEVPPEPSSTTKTFAQVGQKSSIPFSFFL